MGPPLPEKLRVTCASFGALCLVTLLLRCYVRLRIVRSWGLDDTFIVIAFIAHLWYSITLLTGIHYGTGRRTTDISVADSVHAMRCWWLCFLSYSCTIKFAKLSVGFFFLRISGVYKLHRIGTYFIMVVSTLIGISYFIVGLFQCYPIQFYWTRLEGKKDGNCIDVKIMIALTFLYGATSLVTDMAFGLMVFVLIWNLKVDRRTKYLISPFLALACIASYGAAFRMPYIKHFGDADFLYATVDISLTSTIEVGVAVFAANLATLRPLCKKFVSISNTISAHIPGVNSMPFNAVFSFQNVPISQPVSQARNFNKEPSEDGSSHRTGSNDSSARNAALDVEKGDNVTFMTTPVHND